MAADQPSSSAGQALHSNTSPHSLKYSNTLSHQIVLTNLAINFIGKEIWHKKESNFLIF